MKSRFALLPPNVRGIVAMTASALVFITNDTLIKVASASLPMGEIMCLRGLIGGTLLLTIILATPLRSVLVYLADKRMLIRTIGEMGATGLYLPALFHLPIATSTLIAQTVPLGITAGAAIFFKEPVGWRRWSAIVIGFIGVVIVARPGPEGISVWALFAMASVAAVAVRDLITRTFPPEVPGLAITVAAAAGVTLLGFLLGFGETWVWPTPAQFLILAAASCFLLSGYFLIILAMRSGEISVVSPFRYTIIPFALFYGFLVWRDVPDWPMILGTAIIIGTGVYTFWRERLRHRSVEPKFTTPVPS